MQQSEDFILFRIAVVLTLNTQSARCPWGIVVCIAQNGPEPKNHLRPRNHYFSCGPRRKSKTRHTRRENVDVFDMMQVVLRSS